MPKRSSNKQPEDFNTLAKFILDKTTMEQAVSEGKNPAAVALGRLGGLKGGKARAASLSVKRRKQIAIQAAKARWDKKS